MANPSLRNRPGDGLKYIALAEGDPDSYLSFGMNLRERMEYNDAVAFGTGGSRSDSYLIQRLQVHADLHLDKHWQLFTQLEDARDYGKQVTTPADRNPADVRLAFVAYNTTMGDNTFKFRVGRQEFAFDLQRFVSLRDGPNVRQAYDAIWADWETPDWRVIGFVSQPVQYRDAQDFDDYSDRHLRFNMVRAEHPLFGTQELSAYYALYSRDNAHYIDASGRESRHILDVRYAGGAHGLDWDLETMLQRGSVGASDIRAWAIGTRAGYTFATTSWQPRLGLQLDAASGDHHGADHTLGTFNPLFPNGYYLTLAGYTGYVNFIHLKPSVTVKPVTRLTLTAALALQWRQTTADAVYTQPNIPIPGTAGHGGRRTGSYGQLRGDYAINSNLVAALEMVHFEVGDALRRAGAHNSNYLGAELKYQW
ncbi:MAG TPA: alginate export family protein [Pinirhizobacter sp.]|uniref:alginate export family protein n=1 Tax=Pinirhizobacter sp. TaxID=2950432 RepID=UPI002C3757FB|nr:alginate export family protein [Pinirhizobacter sp.]HMH67255.1 alginate export family protein [Pinirhizobacter sp.]